MFRAVDLLRPNLDDPLAIDADATPGLDDRDAAEAFVETRAGVLSERQEQLYAASRAGGTRRVLLVLQAMDTAGKGGIVRHVVGRVDPQGVALTAFKAPTDEERAHDFLWRIEKRLPGAGLIGVFDRSHYEDVLIHRVRGFSTPEEVERRYGAIVDFEQRLVNEGTDVVKVMLHISRDEQRARLAERIARPDKHWKYNPGDVDERALWDDYMEAYRIAIRRTDATTAPWFVVPANHKWYARAAVTDLLTDALERIDPQWPPAHFDPAVEAARLEAS